MVQPKWLAIELYSTQVKPLMNSRLRWCWLGLMILPLAACQSEGTPDAVRAMHAPISDSLTGPGAREGSWRGADQRSTWRATLDGPLVTRIDEQVTYTDSATAMREYHYDENGRLSSAREERTQITFGSRATPDTLRVMIDLQWAADSLVQSEKRLNGEARLVQPFEVDNMRYHGVELLMTARAGAPIIFPGSKSP